MKRLLALALALSVLLTPTFAAEAAVSSFSDVPSAYWAYGAITQMTEQGLFSGVSVPANGVGTFAPEATMTRAEFITVVDRALYSTELNAMPVATPWWKNAYTLAVSKGILTAAELDNGDMTKSMSRQEMALVLSRATTDTPSQLLSTNRIPDYSSIGAAYKDAVVKVYSLGMLTGVDNNGTFAPTATMTRAQGATVLNRLTNKSARVVVDFTAVAPTQTATANPVLVGTETEGRTVYYYTVETNGYKYVRVTMKNLSQWCGIAADNPEDGRNISSDVAEPKVSNVCLDVSGFSKVRIMITVHEGQTGELAYMTLENAANTPAYSIPSDATAITDANSVLDSLSVKYLKGQFICHNTSPMGHTPGGIKFDNKGWSSLTFTVTTLDSMMYAGVYEPGVKNSVVKTQFEQSANTTKTYTVNILGASTLGLCTYNSYNCDSIITNVYVK